jgi:CheY-like chemotaxis protein
MRLDRGDSEATDEALAIAGRQVGHMARLLDDLLDVARFSRGNIQLRKVQVGLSSILEQAIETSRPSIVAGGHHLSTSFPETPVWLEGDPTRLAQVVANLLNNAAKYTDPGGQISLIATLDGNEAVVKVKDNGIGLSSEMLPRVFDLFSQEDRSLDRSQGGLGIGLTLVRSLVQLHGGRIQAKSQGPDLGSEFTIHLPVSVSTPRIDQKPAKAATEANERDRAVRVLVVDDSQDSARSLARVLKLWGHETHVVHDGPDALEAIVTNSFDVIFLDIGLPGMNGYEVGEMIRHRYGSNGPMLVALTGYGQEEDLSRSKSIGFDDHLIKPVDLVKVKEMLSHRGSLSSQQQLKHQ